YTYDQGTNAIGHLSSITETNSANQVTSQIAYAYDLHGRVTSDTRTVNGVLYRTGYAYDKAGRLSGMTYPSSRTVTYAFDGVGRVNQVTTTKDTKSQVGVSTVLFQPSAAVKSYTPGTNKANSRATALNART